MRAGTVIAMWNEAGQITTTETSAITEAYATTADGQLREGENEEEEDYGDIFHWQDTLMREVRRWVQWVHQGTKT